MVKVVDHEERRLVLAHAVWRVIARSGIHGATVRAVAQEAGVSPGSLRHYFSDQLGLVRFAAEHMSRQLATRISALLEKGSTGRAGALAILLECLPVDDERRVECAVWVEALVQSRHDPQLTQLRENGFLGARHVCRLALAMDGGLELPSLGAQLPEPHEARAGLLHSCLDGLTLQATTTPTIAPQDVSTHLKAMLDTLRAGHALR